jgi:hypothetical protein
LSKALATVEVVLATTIVLTAQLSTPAQRAVTAFRSAIVAAESGAGSGSIEAAFSALLPLRNALTHGREGREAVLESLPESDFRRLKRELRGALINRDEVVFVEPDIDYFVNLATTRGDRADKAFFAAMKMTYPESIWPVYEEQLTDYSGCTRFGSGDLVRTYAVWSEFQSRYPDRYNHGAAEQWESIRRELTDGTCACDDGTSVKGELDELLRAFPTSPDRSKIERRLLELDAGRSGIRFNCQPG